ncbi:hypothetical protein LWI29_036938 [Acer saccharum]|uniref:Uncharacterized protein n=1 Tax=Acer saccharum TaxID=4024 RepID=A0AA39RT59_ACESA|nr:hypothetical protein LWI29_036938 [Acer saccharum]
MSLQQPPRSIHTTLDRPSPTNVSSWVPPVLNVSSPSISRPPSTLSSAVLSPELPPHDASISKLPANPVLLSPPVGTHAAAATQSTTSHAAGLVGQQASESALVTDSSEPAGQASPGAPSASVSPRLQPWMSPSTSLSAASTAASPTIDPSSQATNTTSPPVNEHPMQTRAKDNIRKPIRKLNLHSQLQQISDGL